MNKLDARISDKKGDNNIDVRKDYMFVAKKFSNNCKKWWENGGFQLKEFIFTAVFESEVCERRSVFSLAIVGRWGGGGRRRRLTSDASLLCLLLYLYTHTYSLCSNTILERQCYKTWVHRLPPVVNNRVRVSQFGSCILNFKICLTTDKLLAFNKLCEWQKFK